MAAKKQEKASDCTLRDEFAKAAMQGLVSLQCCGDDGHLAHVAKTAYAAADAMLEARGEDEVEAPVHKK